MAIEELFQQLAQWMQDFSVQYGYLGVFLISFLGSVSIIFPIPYTVVLFAIGSIEAFNPILIALASAIGSAIGEFSGYLLGLGGRKIISEERKRKMEFLLKIFGKFGPVAIFIFALMPLPDDLLFIPLGVMRYSFLKAFIPTFLGKLSMSLIIVYSAGYVRDIIRTLFGVESDWISAMINMIIALILMAIIFLLMFKLDWEKIFEKYMTKRKQVK
ncbi:VTT domain-containing protein [Candidatus Bathyarchaeota archaeon]|nr:VTT domain-containing protein [Candidatus Bathyarchaeota archaeon]